MELHNLNYIFDKKNIKNSNELLNCMYKNYNDCCFVRVLSKKNNKSKAYLIGILKQDFIIKSIENVFKKEDLMLSLNAFKTMKSARRSNIFCINNLAIDVDYKKIKEFKDLTPIQVLHLLEFDFFDKTIPTPNLVEYGNQLRLIYNLSETVYIPKGRNNALVLSQRICKVFSERLKDYGAEEQKLESYFRFINSINTKNNSEIKIIQYVNSKNYTLGELQEIWLDEIPKWYKKIKKQTKSKSKVRKLHNVFSLNSNRLLDFEKIQAYLNLNNIKDLRARLCFLYRNYVLIKIKAQNGFLLEKDYKFAKNEMIKFNKNFNYPLRENIIEGATRVVNSHQYIYRNETLADFLELDFNLCKELDLQSIFKVKTRKEIEHNYYERIKSKKQKKYLEELKKENKLTEKEKLFNRRLKVKALLEKGLKQNDIVKLLSVSKSTISCDVKKIKEQDLI